MQKIETINLNGIIAESVELVKIVFSDDFTKRHLDLILSVISVAKNDDEKLIFEIPTTVLAKIYNPANPWGKELKKEIHKIASDLMNLKFGIPNKEKDTIKWYHWVKTVEVPKNPTDADVVIIELSNAVKRFYVQLHQQGLFYTLKNILKLRTLTEAKIYHWAYAKKGFENAVPISIDDAKYYFVGDTELKTSEFTKKYLEPAIKRINEKTDLWITYEKVCADKRNAKKISSLKFTISCSYEKKKPMKPRTDAQKKSDRERGIALWQHCRELEEENQFLTERNCTLEKENIALEELLYGEEWGI